MYQMKRFIDMGTVTFAYVFAFINLVCVQSVIQLMNELSLLYYDERLFHFFFRSETVTFVCYLYTSRPSLLFSVE